MNVKCKVFVLACVGALAALTPEEDAGALLQVQGDDDDDAPQQTMLAFTLNALSLTEDSALAAFADLVGQASSALKGAHWAGAGEQARRCQAEKDKPDQLKVSLDLLKPKDKRAVGLMVVDALPQLRQRLVRRRPALDEANLTEGSLEPSMNVDAILDSVVEDMERSEKLILGQVEDSQQKVLALIGKTFGEALRAKYEPGIKRDFQSIKESLAGGLFKDLGGLLRNCKEVKTLLSLTLDAVEGKVGQPGQGPRLALAMPKPRSK